MLCRVPMEWDGDRCQLGMRHTDAGLERLSIAKKKWFSSETGIVNASQESAVLLYKELKLKLRLQDIG